MLSQYAHESLLAQELNINNFLWIDAMDKPVSNDTNPNSIDGCDAKLFEK